MSNSTKNILTISAVALALVAGGCTHRASTNWAKDCDKNFSIDSREYAVCKEANNTKTEEEMDEKTSAKTDNQNTVSVVIDKENANRPAIEDMGKGYAH